MIARIPTLGSLGLLALSATACSDASKVADAYKAVCKAQCECPDSGFDDEGNCKKACSGWAKVIEAEYLDAEEDPCGDLDDILDDFKACASKSCSEIAACLYGDGYANYYDSVAGRLYECWPTYDYDDYYPLLPLDTLDEIQSTIEALPRAIPRPLLRQALHAAACAEPEPELAP